MANRHAQLCSEIIQRIAIVEAYEQGGIGFTRPQAPLGSDRGGARLCARRARCAGAGSLPRARTAAARPGSPPHRG
jgi:hypothetical protein